MQSNNNAYKTKYLGGDNADDQSIILVFSLLENLMEHYKKLKKYVMDNRDLKSEEKKVRQILQKLYIGSDSELASKDIQNCIDASIKVSNMIHKCFVLVGDKFFILLIYQYKKVHSSENHHPKHLSKNPFQNMHKKISLNRLVTTAYYS